MTQSHLKQSIINCLYHGTSIQCNKWEYHDYVRDTILEFIKLAKSKGDEARAILAHTILNNFDSAYGNPKNLTGKDYEHISSLSED